MKTFLKILDIASNCLLCLFAVVFALIGASSLFCLIIEGDLMNLAGVIGGFAMAWLCWNI